MTNPPPQLYLYFSVVLLTQTWSSTWRLWCDINGAGNDKVKMVAKGILIYIAQAM